MPFYGSLQVIDQDGWTKTFQLEKALLMIGSGAVNDIVLPAGGFIAPVHLQVLRPAIENDRLRLINLTPRPLTIRRAIRGSTRPGELPPNGTGEMSDGDQLELGEYRLIFSIQAQRGITCKARSQNIGLMLELPGVELQPNRQLAGRLTLANYGNQGRCQFEIDLEGLPPDCYQIDPAPILFPQDEHQIEIRFYHRGQRPLAGEREVTLHVTAPAVYPTEEVVLRMTLQVAPVSKLDLTISADRESPWVPAEPIRARTTPIRETLPVLPPTLNAPAIPAAPAAMAVEPPQAHYNPPNSAGETLTAGAPPAQPGAPALEPEPARIPAPEPQDWFAEETTAPVPARRPRLDSKQIPILRAPSNQPPAGGPDPAHSPSNPANDEEQA